MASHSDMLLYDPVAHSRHVPAHPLHDWYARVRTPLAHRIHHSASALENAPGGTKEAVFATVGTIAALSAVRYYSKNDHIPMAAELGATLIGTVGAVRARDAASALPYVGVGAVGAAFLASRTPAAIAAMKQLSSSSTAQLPARSGGAVAGDFGAEDPIIAAARHL